MMDRCSGEVRHPLQQLLPQLCRLGVVRPFSCIRQHIRTVSICVIGAVLLLAGIYSHDGNSLLTARSLPVCRSTWSSRRIRQLPPAGHSEEQLQGYLASFLTRSGLMACKRLLRMGGETVMFGVENTTLAGDQMVCVDPEFSMARDDCVVYAFSSCDDRSFQRAAEQFGCITHAWPACHLQSSEAQPVPRDLDQLVIKLNHSRQQLGFLALTVPSDQIVDMLEKMPNALCDSVQQLGLVMDISEGAGGSAGAEEHQMSTMFMRWLYDRLRKLQDCGFRLFDIEDVEVEDAISVHIGRQTSINSIVRLSFMKTACT